MSAADLWWTNMMLLGFDAVSMEAQHGVAFEQEMFRRSGSLKAVNVLLHFLLSRVDPVHTRDTFRGVWPILDKGQEKDFRKLAFARLSELERAGCLPTNSVRLSDLTSAKGDRLYTMLWYLSNEALRRSLERAGLPVPRVPEVDVSTVSMGPLMIRTTMLKVADQRERFLLSVQEAREAQREWEVTAKDCALQWEAAHSELTELRRSKRKLDSQIGRGGGGGACSTGQADQVREIWLAISEHEKATDHELIQSILSGQQWPYLVRAATDENLARSVSRYTERLSQPLPKLNIVPSSLLELQLQQQQQQLHTLQSLQTKLTGLKTSVNEDVTNLFKKVGQAPAHVIPAFQDGSSKRIPSKSVPPPSVHQASPALQDPATTLSVGAAVLQQQQQQQQPPISSLQPPQPAPAEVTPVTALAAKKSSRIPDADSRTRLAASARRIAGNHPSFPSALNASATFVVDDLDLDMDVTFLNRAPIFSPDMATMTFSPAVPRRLNLENDD